MNAPTARPYYPALDGLRGIAILLVVVYHNFGFIDYFSFGWLGVDLFFVLSGFLITDILLKKVNDAGYLKNFYLRRVLRIFPLYYLVLIVFLLIIPRLNLLSDLGYYVDNQIWLWTYLQNWLFIFNGADNTLSLHHLWSLAVEEQFYLVWPLVVLLIRKPGMLLILTIVLLLGVVVLRIVVWNAHYEDFSYYKFYTFTRIDGLCIGCMIALLHRINLQFLKKNTSFIVLFFALMNFGFFFLNQKNEFQFPYLAIAGYTTFAMIFGLIVHEVVTSGTNWFNDLLSFLPLRFLGKISYGLYIFHWPVYLIFRNKFGQTISALSISFLATVTAILISVLSFYTFERYFLKIKERISQ